MYKQFEYNMKNRPHVVILGAGASCAAIPNGDKSGRKISAMSDFIEKLGLNHIISKVNLLTDSNNLEDIYMELDERSKNEPNCNYVKKELEKVIRTYMNEFVLPDNPTVYDYLVMSLTSKDLIATFNWDPLLVQSVCRVQQYTTNTPQIAFLHGNVAVGYCQEDNIMGCVGMRCRCGKILEPTKLLFPIKHKNYTEDIAISKSWKQLKNSLERAYMITIFGYSAPKSDVEAVKMLKQAWGAVENRKLEEIELVDIREEDEVVESWDGFIYANHYSYHTSFFDTTLAKCPRRSCEATFDRLMNNMFLNGDKGFRDGMSFDDVYEVTCQLIREEKTNMGNNTPLSNPYL